MFAPGVLSRPARRRASRYTALAISTLLTVTLADVPARAAVAAERGAPAVARQSPARGVGLTPEKAKPDPSADRTMRKADTVVWPAGGSAEKDATGTGSGLSPVGGLPVGVTPVKGAKSLASAPQRVKVQVFDRATSTRLGMDGPVFRLHRTDAATATGKVTVRAGYGSFAHAYGGDWGARLRLVALPACALTSPGRQECRTGKVLPTANDNGRQILAADIDAAAVESQATVFAMAAAESSAQGDYKATQLSPSSSWSVALSSGGFSWTYPIRTPQTPGGFGPQIALSYSSQAVDGRTTATNNQGSWIGEGFTYEPGYIERRYKPCKDDGHDGSAEQCWAFYNGTMMLSGHSGSLVKVNDDLWKLSTDDGSKIERFSGGVNGDNDGEYWKVTTTDGSQYFFGKNRLPGWSTGDEETESVWTVPVFGDDSGEPCHQTSGFDDSWCQQAWRWNLDYVVDPRGNVISYFYNRETNYYARGGHTDVDGTVYHRGGYLVRIDYGQRDQQVYTTNAPARILFDTLERCIPGGSTDCDPEDLKESTAASWPDVPEDLICAAGTHCDYTQASPTYFTRKRLVKIETQIRQGTGWQPVESWALEHEFKLNDDNSRTLWLKRILHTGHWGDPDITLPATELDGIQLPNRIVRDGDLTGPLIRYRLETVKNGSGAQITINYKAPDCTKDNLPTAGRSTRRCFPVIWNPLGGGDENKVTDWFQKYVVDNVVEDDLVGGNDDMVTAYDYIGDAAWRKAEPDGITKTEDLTWSDWRGYSQVSVRTGDGQSMPARVDHFFLRGMSEGKQPDGSTPIVTRSDSTGTQYTDYDAWSGHELETVAYNGADIVSKTINEPWRHVTYTQTESWGTSQAVIVRVGTVRKLVAMPDDPQGNDVWRETRTVTGYDTTWGRIVQVDDLGDVAPGGDGDDTCTRTWYDDNAAKYMYAYVSRIQSVSVKCDVADPDLSTQLLSDTRTSYDFQSWNTPPNLGTATLTEDLDRYDGTKILYIPTSQTVSVDTYGRPTATKNALGYLTTTEYTETDGMTTQVKAVTPAPFNYATITTQDPAFGVPLAVVDANLNRTELAYDSFGRQTAVWLADRDRSQGATPSMKFSYDVRTDKPTVVKTERINNDGSYRTSYELFDGLLRPRQTQTPGPNGAWILTDTFYIGTGQAAKKNDPYLALGTSGGMPIVTPEGSTNGQTTTVYDGAGRPIAGTYAVAGDPKWTTTTSYEGDRTSIDPPAGATPTTVVTDARGRTIELRQYHGDSPSGPADVTRYTYTPSGSLETVTDAAGNTWIHHYNQRNLKEWVEDPDSGDLHYTYDAVGNITSTTDARGVVLSYKYDELGRKTEMWQGQVGTGTKLAAWVFDTLPGNKGQLHYNQRIVGGNSYYTVYALRDKLYRPLKINYSFPSGDIGSLLGKSYQFTVAYNTDGTVQSNGFPAAGGLPEESVVAGYDSLLRPTTLTGTTSYVTSTIYGDLGELRQTELHTGGTNKKAWLTYEYERGTGRLTRSRLDRQGVATIDMDAHYDYDDAGNVVSIADTPTTPGGVDIQCFSYDNLRRLTEAWTHNSATKTCSDGVDETGVGGPAPYHYSWTFDAAGNRDIETIYSITGGTDAVRDYDYPAPGQPQPHAVRSVTETGPAGDKTFIYGYDVSGNTICRPAVGAGNACDPAGAGSQELAWNAEGSLDTSKPNGGQNTTYVYDADGNRIARKEPGGKATIYMPGMELASSGTSVTATRYYSFAGRSVALRNTTGVYFSAADQHGTANCTINAVSGAITWRRTTPYGATRGTAPVSWPNEKGFVGGTQDPSGLTHLGAREYDPGTGRFVSVDPLIDPNNPGELGGYAYAANNPVTYDDPTGRMLAADGGSTYVPLTYKNPTTVVDQNGVPHVLKGTSNKPEEVKALNFLNDQLRANGEYFDPNTKTGSVYVFQDEDNPLVDKGPIVGADGRPTVTGTTADAVKISYIDGKIVSVDTYDFTTSVRPGASDGTVSTINKKMDLTAKQQTQNVVFIAKDDAQAAALREKFAGHPNVRIINPGSGFDTGELYSGTHTAALRARGIQPRGAAQTVKGAKVGRFTGALGALNLVADIYMIWQAADAFATKDPNEQAIKANMLACGMFSPTCQDMVYSNGYIYHYDGFEWVNSGVKATAYYNSQLG